MIKAGDMLASLPASHRKDPKDTYHRKQRFEIQPVSIYVILSKCVPVNKVGHRRESINEREHV